MKNRVTGDTYADAVMQRCEGRPVPNIHRLIADAYNAGFVAATLERQGRTLRERMQTPPITLGGPAAGERFT